MPPTMKAESCIGMFSAMIKAFPRYEVLTCSNLIKAKKNKIQEFIMNCTDDDFSFVVSLALTHSRAELERNKINKTSILKEIDCRIIQKNLKLEATNKKKIANTLKKIVNEHPHITPELLSEKFSTEFITELLNILKGNILFRNITHIRCVNDQNIKFRGLVKSVNEYHYNMSYYRE